MRIKTAKNAAWIRIRELVEAIKSEYDKRDGDALLVDKWAQEITWQCSIIDAFKEEDKHDQKC